MPPKRKLAGGTGEGESKGAPKTKRKTEPSCAATEAVAAAALTLSEFTLIHRFLHDPLAPISLHLARFGASSALSVATARWGKRKVVLPGLGEVSVVDDREAKTTVYAGRARAGGCLSWWNPMAWGGLASERPWRFSGAYSSTLESLTATGPVTVSAMGRFPPVKDGPRAPVEDVPGTMTKQDPSCMATADPSDPCFTPKPAEGEGAPVTAVERAKQACRCAACGAQGSKNIEVGQLRFRYMGGRYDRFVHPACATAQHLPSVEHLEQCPGFLGLRPEQQGELRGLDVFQAA